MPTVSFSTTSRPAKSPQPSASPCRSWSRPAPPSSRPSPPADRGAAVIRPILAIVGRPNVGKSTLFNRLVGRRRSLVHDVPGVTRDRLYGTVTHERWQATVVDTGGFDPTTESDLVAAVRSQVMLAIEEADLVIFVVDGRDGLTGLDEEIAIILRKSRRPVVLAVNKIDGAGQEGALADFYRLGFPTLQTISGEHGRGVAELLETARDQAPPPVVETHVEGVRVAIIGRPNVGKSSLVNAVLGEPRVLVHELPGTTRDSGDTPVSFRDRPYLLIDTAGIRRKGRTSETLEKLSVVMALKSLERADVAVLVMDAAEGVTAQDAHIGATRTRRGAASSWPSTSGTSCPRTWWARPMSPRRSTSGCPSSTMRRSASSRRSRAGVFVISSTPSTPWRPRRASDCSRAS